MLEREELQLCSVKVTLVISA
jgi:factor associated with neutral sphingomyelinase activation